MRKPQIITPNGPTKEMLDDDNSLSRTAEDIFASPDSVSQGAITTDSRTFTYLGDRAASTNPRHHSNPSEIFLQQHTTETLRDIRDTEIQTLQKLVRVELSPIVSEIQSALRALETRRIPETRWIRNLGPPSYNLSDHIPIVIERAGNLVSATYDDAELSAEGEDVPSAIRDLCTLIIDTYERVKAQGPATDDPRMQRQAFLRQIISEVQKPDLDWKTFQDFYAERLKEFEDVKQAFIRIHEDFAQIFIQMTDFSMDLVEELAGIELDASDKWEDLRFDVEYVTRDLNENDQLKQFYPEV